MLATHARQTSALAGAACSLAAVVWATPGAAAPIEVRYEATAACPGGAEFREQLEARVDTTAASHAAAARTFAVRIDAEGGGFVGRFRGSDVDGRRVTQDVRGPGCADVFDALVLIAALAIDPEAASSRAATGARPESRAAPSSGGEPSKPWAVSAGLQALVTGGLGPGVAPGLGAFVDAASPPTGVVSPSVRLGVSVAEGSTGVESGGHIETRWIGVRASACPLQFGLAARLWASACAGAGLASLGVQGRGLVHDRESGSFLVDLEVAARLRGDWFEPWFFELEGAAGAPLMRPETVIDAPSKTVYRVPGAEAQGAAAVGVRF